MIVGYAWVSTEGPTLEAQQAALSAAGAEKVFAEKISGRSDREKGTGSRDRGPWSGGCLACNAIG